jgi:DUF1009 family protein
MLALIAGGGRLPHLIATQLADQETPFVLCSALGTVLPWANDADVLPIRLEHLGTVLLELKQRGVTEVCFAGGVTRPKIDHSEIDALTRPLLEKLLGGLVAGDDGALRLVLGMFEESGFRIKAAHDVVPDLLLSEGVPTHAKPSDHDGADAGRGEAIVQAMGRVDVGQACVVSKGQALAVEALPGTDAMLRALSSQMAPAPSATVPTRDALRGLMFKAPKPMQDRRVDLPTIGPDTMTLAHAANLRGVVIEAGGVIVLDPQATIAAADKLGLFLWVRRSGTQE